MSTLLTWINIRSECIVSCHSHSNVDLAGGELEVEAEEESIPNVNLANDSDPTGPEGTNGVEDDLDDDLEGMATEADAPPEVNAYWSSLDEAGRTPLFAGSNLSVLAATLILLNLCRVHHVSNLFITELLLILSKSILPAPNSLPVSESKASAMLRKLGLGYKTIHACPKGCVLFRGAIADALVCPKCGSHRWKRSGRSIVPVSVLRHFPLISRLRRMFATPTLASFMTWHRENKSADGVMRSPVDSDQWRHIEASHPEFESDPRNLHLGVGADGVNPYAQKRSTFSVWPILIFNYNIAPWLTIKKYFIILALLIPGPNSVTAEHIDVFIAPLLEELMELWMDGVPCFDAAQWNGESRFVLRAMVIWMLHDFPAFAMMAGTTNKGYKGCPVCGPATFARYSRSLSKLVYGGEHRRWLPENHLFRHDCTIFPSVELRGPPARMVGTEHVRWASLREEYLRHGGTDGGDADPYHFSGVKRMGSFHALPYWTVRASPLHRPHCFCCMVTHFFLM